MNDTTHVRVRFAPSPTGHLHIGGLRTALFNFLFTRNKKGSFLLRIEDTDTERSKEEYTQSIIGSFAWVDIVADEEPVIQSHRLPEHKKIVASLIAQKKAYRCFCKPDDHIKRQQANNSDLLFFKYDGHCRFREAQPEDEQLSYVVRFALPQDRTHITFQDLIRGTVTFAFDQFDDFVIARSDGGPIYNFVVVVDDAFMRISHVIRAEEHLSNTPKQLLLYEACGFTPPIFAHVPLILGPSGDKLSKRDAATSVLEYRRMGYLPHALINYLARLGWSHGDQEIFTLSQLIDCFSLADIGKKGAIFDIQKLNWVNSVYIKQADVSDLLTIIEADVEPLLTQQLPTWSRSQISAAMTLYQDRVYTLKELVMAIRVLHDGPASYQENELQQWIHAKTVDYLEQFMLLIEQDQTFTVQTIKEAVTQLSKQLGIKLVELAQPTRLAIIGSTSGPGAFELLMLIGKTEGIRRIRHLIGAARHTRA